VLGGSHAGLAPRSLFGRLLLLDRRDLVPVLLLGHKSSPWSPPHAAGGVRQVAPCLPASSRGGPECRLKPYADKGYYNTVSARSPHNRSRGGEEVGRSAPGPLLPASDCQQAPAALDHRPRSQGRDKRRRAWPAIGSAPARGGWDLPGPLVRPAAWLRSPSPPSPPSAAGHCLDPSSARDTGPRAGTRHPAAGSHFLGPQELATPGGARASVAHPAARA
jgi:hypothetical protein